MHAQDQLPELTRAFVREYVDERLAKGLPQGNNVQFGPIGRRLWKPPAEPPETFLDRHVSLPRGPVNLYVCPSPYCAPTDPGACGFCLFPHENHTGAAALDTYVAMLRKEFRLLEPWYKDDQLASVYFGGGTPNLLRPEQYPIVMGYVDQLYGGIPEGIEVTLEGLPQGFTSEAKVRAMSECGINRISMGVQQIQDHLIALSGRKQRSKHVLRALELARKYNLAHSIDLVCGWPDQTVDDMLADLAVVVEQEVPHLTRYDLSIDGPSAFARRKMRARLPTLDQNREMYHVAQAYLTSEGYEQVSVYDWRRAPREGEEARLGEYSYEQRMHHFDQSDDGADTGAPRRVCGIGFAANTFEPHGVVNPGAPSWIHQNSATTAEYYEQLNRGVIPVKAGFSYSREDERLLWLFQTSQTRSIDTDRYRELFGHDIREPLGHYLDELSDRGWIEVSEGAVRFVDDGEFYIPMLQDAIAEPRRQQLTRLRREATRGQARIESIPVTLEAV